MPVALYGRETLSLMLREERRLCLLENRELRRIFVPKRDEETGDWNKPHKKNLMIGSPQQILFVDLIENSEMAGHVALIGERRAVYGFLTGKHEGKRRLGRPRRRWKDNINMGLRKRDGEDGLDSSGSG